MITMQNHYQVLKLAPNASSTQIKTAFRHLARRYHPDLNPDDIGAAEEFRRICLAYEVLSNPSQRSQYDLAFQQSSFVKSPQTSTGGAIQREFQKCYALGVNQVSRKNYSAAISEFSRAIALNPRYIEAYMGRCQARFALGDDQGVLEDCRQILLIKPNTAQALFFQGRSRHRLGHIELAIEDFSQAIVQDKEYAKAYYQRGLAQLELAHQRSAKQDLQKAAKVFRQQNNTTSYQRVMSTLKDLNFAQEVSRGNRLGLFTGFAYLPKVLINPVNELSPVFESLMSAQAAVTGLCSAGIAVGCLLLSHDLYWFKIWSVSPLSLMMLGCVVFCTLWAAHSLIRTIAGNQSPWTGDIFLAGIALLPAGCWFLLSGPIALLGKLALILMAIFSMCYTIVLLYTGYTQIHNASDPIALMIVSGILALCVGVVVYIGQSFLGLPFILG